MLTRDQPARPAGRPGDVAALHARAVRARRSPAASPSTASAGSRIVDSCRLGLACSPGPPGGVTPSGCCRSAPTASGGRTVFTEAWEPRRPAAPPPTTSRPTASSRPCDRQLAGSSASLAHWPWQDPPRTHAASTPVTDVPPTEAAATPPSRPTPTRSPSPDADHRSRSPDLVVLSHLRWHVGVAAPAAPRVPLRRGSGPPRARRTWFVEEPVPADVAAPRCATEEVGRASPGSGWSLPRRPPDRTTHQWASTPPTPPATATCCVELLDGGRARARPTCCSTRPMALDLAADAGRPSGWSTTSWTTSRPSQGAAAGSSCASAGCSPRPTSSSPAAGRCTGRSSQHRAADRCTCSPAASRPRTTPARRALRTAARAPGRRLRRRRRRAAGPRPARRAWPRALPDWTLRVVGPVAKIDPADLPAGAEHRVPRAWRLRRSCPR